MPGPGVRVRIRLRVERGKRGEWDDEETALLEDGEAQPTAWVATPLPKPSAYVVEYGHVLADVEHLLLQDQLRLVEGRVELASSLRLEGHPLHGWAEPLLKAGPVGRGVHRFTSLLVRQLHEVADIYQDPKRRSEFARAVRRPHLLTPVQQRALLTLVLLSSLWVWLVGVTLLAVIAPLAVAPWNGALLVYFHALSTNLFNPLPVEATAVGAAAVIGPSATILAGGAGKAVGAWIIYTLGPLLRKAMLNLEAKSPLTKRVMLRAEAFARRFGYAALGLMLAVPGSPFDIVPVYLFSTLGLRLGPFLAAVFLGFALRLALVVLLGGLLFELL